jgi:glycosyltransferase involved in cell wall biosynthesis
MKFVDVSIVLPFRDHEHLVGRATRHIAEHFSLLGHSFEILAVDEGSGDNSHAVLALLRQEIPQLRIVVGRGYAEGAATAAGQALVLANLSAVTEDLTSSLSQAIARVLQGELDMQLVAEKLLVCQRRASLLLLAEGLTKRQRGPRSLFRRGQARGLRIKSYGPEAPLRSTTGLTRLLSAMMPGTSGLHGA